MVTLAWTTDLKINVYKFEAYVVKHSQVMRDQTTNMDKGKGHAFLKEGIGGGLKNSGSIPRNACVTCET